MSHNVIELSVVAYDLKSTKNNIICNTKREELETILMKVVETSKFKSFELDTYRSYKPGVPKAHYIFDYDSTSKTKYSGKILLDILIEDSIYPETIEKPVITKWIETDSKTMVTVPTVDSITGDKLTAFAPNTVGIPYMKGKQSFSMEICKQLFDLRKRIMCRLQHKQLCLFQFILLLFIQLNTFNDFKELAPKQHLPKD